MAVHLPPFDPGRSFVSQKIFRYEGHSYGRGDPFPNEHAPITDVRKLRNLYEGRFIVNVDSPSGRRLLTTPQSQVPSVPDPVPTRRKRPKPDPLDHDGNGEAGGSKPDEGGDEAERVKRLVSRHNHADLFKKASGLAGVIQTMTKAQIATALVRHNRDGE